MYFWAGFIVGSLILGTVKGNPFVDNLVYGIWTGALAGVVVALGVVGIERIHDR